MHTEGPVARAVHRRAHFIGVPGAALMLCARAQSRRRRAPGARTRPLRARGRDAAPGRHPQAFQSAVQFQILGKFPFQGAHQYSDVTEDAVAEDVLVAPGSVEHAPPGTAGHRNLDRDANAARICQLVYDEVVRISRHREAMAASTPVMRPESWSRGQSMDLDCELASARSVESEARLGEESGGQASLDVHCSACG